MVNGEKLFTVTLGLFRFLRFWLSLIWQKRIATYEDKFYHFFAQSRVQTLKTIVLSLLSYTNSYEEIGDAIDGRTEPVRWDSSKRTATSVKNGPNGTHIKFWIRSSSGKTKKRNRSLTNWFALTGWLFKSCTRDNGNDPVEEFVIDYVWKASHLLCRCQKFF